MTQNEQNIWRSVKGVFNDFEKADRSHHLPTDVSHVASTYRLSVLKSNVRIVCSYIKCMHSSTISVHYEPLFVHVMSFLALLFNIMGCERAPRDTPISIRVLRVTACKRYQPLPSVLFAPSPYLPSSPTPSLTSLLSNCCSVHNCWSLTVRRQFQALF